MIEDDMAGCNDDIFRSAMTKLTLLSGTERDAMTQGVSFKTLTTYARRHNFSFSDDVLRDMLTVIRHVKTMTLLLFTVVVDLGTQHHCRAIRRCTGVLFRRGGCAVSTDVASSDRALSHAAVGAIL
jgi:hypothetical protein